MGSTPKAFHVLSIFSVVVPGINAVPAGAKPELKAFKNIDKHVYKRQDVGGLIDTCSLCPVIRRLSSYFPGDIQDTANNANSQVRDLIAVVGPQLPGGIPALNSLLSNPTDVLGGALPGGLPAGLPTDALGNLPDVSGLTYGLPVPTDVLGLLPIPPDALGAVPGVGGVLGNGIPTDVLGALSTDALGKAPVVGDLTNVLPVLPTDGLPALPTDILGAVPGLPTNAIPALPTDALGGLPLNALSGLPTGVLDTLPINALGGVPLKALYTLPTGVLDLLPTGILDALPGADGLPGLPTALPTEAVGSLPAALPTSALSGLTTLLALCLLALWVMSHSHFPQYHQLPDFSAAFLLSVVFLEAPPTSHPHSPQLLDFSVVSLLSADSLEALPAPPHRTCRHRTFERSHLTQDYRP